MPKRTLEQRFWEKVVREGPDDCWPWMGGLTYGYGYLSSRRAHRVSYELLVGPVPEGLVIDHLCRNKCCVNPAHLEPVTQRQNVMRGDGPTAQNARKTHCKRGHPLAGDNLYLKPPKGGRICRTCHNDDNRLFARRKAAALKARAVMEAE